MTRIVPLLLLGLAFLPQDRLQERTAEGLAGLVTCEHPLGARAGVEILERGGNAVDAAVAAAFAMGVALPSHSGLGGRSQLLVVLKEGRAFHVDGGTEVPKLSGSDAPTQGWKSICVPGSVAALAMAHQESGKLPWSDVLSPAVTLARSKEQKELATTLETLANVGAAAFYTGSIAETIDAEMCENGGFVRREDLAGYRAVRREVLRGSYRGHEVIACDRPASGLAVIEALNLLETFDFPKLPEADREHALIESLRIAFEDRSRSWDNPSRRVETLSSKEYAKKRSAEIDLAKAGSTVLQGDDEGDTTHLSVIDRDGNACSFTQSLGPWFGAGRSRSLGFYWNATQGHAGRLGAGRRHTTGQAPVIVLKENRPVLIVGSAGESRIISAVIQTIHRHLDRSQTLTDSVNAPRWHWEGKTLTYEKRVAARTLDFPATLLDTLKTRRFEPRGRTSGPHFGRVHAIARDAARDLYVAAADPRGSGTSLAARDPKK